MEKRVDDHITVGVNGEEVAARYLTKKGFTLVARNWRPKESKAKVEIDLICKRKRELIFVEVKTRRCNSYDSFEVPAGMHAFSAAKQRHLVRAAQLYLTETGSWNLPAHFDLVCVTFLPDTTVLVNHYSDVIEFRKTLDCSNSSWQPW